ncbi:hypothetical protein CATRI_12400 [Corynebacterium atrinae]|nr:hypothetical protein CATRI_12400 [Corynebacterium atrinae]
MKPENLVPPSRIILADVIAILTFAILARLAHNTPEAPFTTLNVLGTFWPFLLGGITGHAICYATKKPTLPIAPGGLIIWLSTAITGLGIWALRHGELPHWSFIIVASIMSGLLLIGWRGLTNMRAKTKS